MNKNEKTQRGITLIALVITIIVMLILVGVTVTMAVNGGIFENAGKAVGETNEVMHLEKELANGKVQIGNVWYDSIDEYVDTIKGETLDPTLNHKGIIPEGAIYKTDFNDETWDYDTVYSAGQPFPKIIEDRDIYIYNDYEYHYNEEVNAGPFDYVNLDGWGCAYTGYEEVPPPILESINGKLIKSLAFCFGWWRWGHYYGSNYS